MSAKLPQARPDLSRETPYSAPQPDVPIRLNTNESPYPPPAEVLEEIAQGVRGLSLNRYPDRDAPGLLDLLGARMGQPTDGLWAANGSNEILLQLLLAFGGPGRRALVFEPTYPMHATIARIAGSDIVAGPRDADFEIDLDEALVKIEAESPHVILCCSPNNPTGHVEPLGTIEALAEESGALVIVDEAYGEFSGEGTSARSLLARHPNLAVVKTLSKAWRLAGARVGYVLAHPQVIQMLKVVRLPYHLSALTQLAGCVAIRHDLASAESVDAIVEQRDLLVLELGVLGVKVWPSHANFVLFEVDEPEEVWERLLSLGIAVRRYPGHPRLSRCLRVTAGTRDETAAFLDAMRDIVGDD